MLSMFPVIQCKLSNIREWCMNHSLLVLATKEFKLDSLSTGLSAPSSDQNFKVKVHIAVVHE